MRANIMFVRCAIFRVVRFFFARILLPHRFVGHQSASRRQRGDVVQDLKSKAIRYAATTLEYRVAPFVG